VWRLGSLCNMAKRSQQAANEHEWEQELKDTFLLGCTSATHAQRLALKAQRAGAKGAEKIAQTGKSGTSKKNIHRDMRREMQKNSHWPKLYWANIPLWDCKTESMVKKLHPFLLPHEWLAKAASLGCLSHLGPKPEQAFILEHMTRVANGLGSPAADFVPLGLHCDGVPFGSQVFYSDSLELFSINFPCGNIGMRIPFTSVQKNHLIKHQTYNAILDILAWSLKNLALGAFPVQRHDGKPFGLGEGFRMNLKNHLKPAKALLVEIRADWAALKQVFQFPQQNENSGICWMCNARPSDIRCCDATASWRHHRRTAVSFHQQLQQTGKSCALWGVPGCSCDIVVVDWLHCADLGVSADIMGNLLLDLAEAFPGQDRNVKVQNLWREIASEYDSQSVSVNNRFPTLRLQSFAVNGKSPKLKGKAGHIRHLVPVLDSIVQRTLQSQDAHTRTVVSCMNHLAACYKTLQDFDAQQLDTSARKMALLYCSLEREQLDAGVEKRWKVKPKLHLFLELANFLCLQRHRGNPKYFWTYGDESHGGILRSIAKARGGRNTSAASAQRLLSMWSSNVDLFGMVS
jgi:hypothetical protein